MRKITSDRFGEDILSYYSKYLTPATLLSITVFDDGMSFAAFAKASGLSAAHTRHIVSGSGLFAREEGHYMIKLSLTPLGMKVKKVAMQLRKTITEAKA